MAKRAIFDKKNVLVIGGAGFIGSHLCDELLKKNKVICLDNFSTGNEKNIDHLLSNYDFEFIRHDISEPIDLEKMQELQKFKIEFQGIQEIYNLACPTSPKNFKENIIATLLANSFGVKNSLELARKYEAKYMYFSSSVVYGPRREENQKIVEEDIGLVDFLSDRSAYDEGKRFAEAMVMNFGKFYKIDAKIIRIFRTFGPRMQLDQGEMIPDFVNNALENKDLVIYGDKKFTSSLCYVSDVVDAAMSFMDSDFKGPYNVGSDIELSLADVAKRIIELVDSQSKIVFASNLLFMTPLCLPDIGKIRNDIGWMPIVTLEKGLEKTIDDLRASKGLRDVKQTVSGFKYN